MFASALIASLLAACGGDPVGMASTSDISSSSSSEQPDPTGTGAEEGVIADNTLWSGKVLDPRDPSDHAIVAFNARVAADPRVEHVLLSVRDGVMLARKTRD